MRKLLVYYFLQLLSVVLVMVLCATLLVLSGLEEEMICVYAGCGISLGITAALRPLFRKWLGMNDSDFDKNQ